MDIGERWLWHSEMYAFRRIVLGVPADERTSPCDPDGEWFDAAMVADAELRLIAKRAGGRARRDRAKEDDRREGRAKINAWAQAKGYADVDAYAAAKGIHWSEAYREHINEVLKNSPIVTGINKAITAASLGVKANEYSPTPEQMAAGRRQLGIDPPEGSPA